jgi:hypothetical protein
MKLKTLGLTAIAGLFTASFAYAAPAQLADDMNTMGTDTGNTTMNAPNGTDNIANPNGDTTGMGGTEASNDAVPSTSNIPSSTPNQSSTNTNDDMSADTATGDDDY